MARRELRDDQWKRIQAVLPGQASDPGRTAMDNRNCVDAVRWIARTGAHWRKLPTASAPGPACSTDTTGGRTQGEGNGCSVHDRATPLSNTCCWIPPSSAPTSPVRAQKGGSGDGSPWPFERRAADKNPSRGRWPRQSPALYPDAGTGVGRHTGRTRAANLARSVCHCRQGIRQPQDRLKPSRSPAQQPSSRHAPG